MSSDEEVDGLDLGDALGEGNKKLFGTFDNTGPVQ